MIATSAKEFNKLNQNWKVHIDIENIKTIFANITPKTRRLFIILALVIFRRTRLITRLITLVICIFLNTQLMFFVYIAFSAVARAKRIFIVFF
jgi:hypothetical protein